MKPISTHLSLAIIVCSLSCAALPGARAAQIDIDGPPGSGRFGTTVTVLPNGNFVVTDPGYDAPGAIVDVGAVYLYDGATLAVISTLTGSTAGDLVGNRGITVLDNGNYVVRSEEWHGARGAVTWGSGATGVSGAVSPANSLVGSQDNDRVGYRGVIVLANGNYVVNSPFWANGTENAAGAVTWGNGTTGLRGVVSAANSLVGSRDSDYVGYGGILALSNGNYVVTSLYWANGTEDSAGAVTWGSGTDGVSGVISAANSLVGTTANDRVGDDGVTVLANGNYVVCSARWNKPLGRLGSIINAGAVTWGSGKTGVRGAVSAANSVIGSTLEDSVGAGGVTVLRNGSYVISSPFWNNGAVAEAGAVTWCSGKAIDPDEPEGWGAVSAANSLVGSHDQDGVGYNGVTVLANGNYVVSSPYWDNGSVVDAGAVTWGYALTGVVSTANSLVGTRANDRVSSGGVTSLANGNYVVRSLDWNGELGAVTWGNGSSGARGTVSAVNSLVGTTATGQIGESGVTALANGNYVVGSSYWSGERGAVTWGNGTNGVSGVVSADNSLVGSQVGDDVGFSGVTALSNGNYVVSSGLWGNGMEYTAGAVTWGNGRTGVKGEVSSVNSLVGGSANDSVGYYGVTALRNGNYVVSSGEWSAVRGAVTWGNGTNGVIGVVSSANSLVGSSAYDHVGASGVTALADGNYAVQSADWGNGAELLKAGAVSFGDGRMGTQGAVTAANSVLGAVSGGGLPMNFSNDLLHSRLLAGFPTSNRVSLFHHTQFIVIARIPEGIRLRFSGAPGRSYDIERAPAVTGPWSIIGTRTVSPGELTQLIEHIDTAPPAGQAFYRTVTAR